jgi:hypothetical protein
LQLYQRVMNKLFSPYFLLASVAMIWLLSGITGCANIIPPEGGPRDTIPPVLVESNPQDSSTNVKTNRVTLHFNEYVEIQSAQENVLVSPLPANTPTVDYKLRTVTIKLRDTLEQNTTYSINFGNAIRDINESNVLQNFTYVFSTGNTIDSNTLTGKVVLAETGKIDTTLLVVLHRNLDDSAVAKERPRYVGRLDSKGIFRFTNLPVGTFALYALPNDYSKKYDDSAKLFAFVDSAIVVGTDKTPITLYAYNFPKAPTTATPPATNRAATPGRGVTNAQDKVVKYTTNLPAGGKHDIFKDVEINFNKGIFTYDSTRILLTDEKFVALPGYHFTLDSTRRKLVLNYPWTIEKSYHLLLPKDAITDSAGATLARNDTLKITTKTNEDYGSVKLRFNNLDLTRNPVLLLLQNEKIVEASPLTQREWVRKMFAPGEYEMRILFDTNKNGKWDPGSFFGEKRQPEIVRDLNIKLDVRGNWDNEKEISL